jgi:hypothetical protein
MRINQISVLIHHLREQAHKCLDEKTEEFQFTQMPTILRDSMCSI